MSFFNNLSGLFNQARDDKQPPTTSASVQKSRQSTKPKATKPGENKLSKQPQASSKQSNKSTQEQQQTQPTPLTSLTPVDVSSHDLVREAKAQAREIILEAKDQAYQLKQQTEQELRKQQQEIDQLQRQLTQKLDRIDDRLAQLDQRDQKLDQLQDQLHTQREQLEEKQQQVEAKLHEVADLDKSEAESRVIELTEKRLSRQLAQMIRHKTEDAQAEADQKVQEILIDSMKYGATDQVPEYTVSVVKLPNDEAKGKIIGKNGRNIHAFERITGVDLDLDTGAAEVKLSSFDAVRREVARISLERLLKDGRIQPSRIEEIVKKVRSEIDKIIFDAGKNLAHQVGVYNLPNDLIKLLGRFKYRTSYGQNMITHTLEETKIGIKLAHELGVDVNIVKLGCLFHDIGKVADEVEGSHVELGVRIAKKFNLPQGAIDAIAQHHEDEPFTGPEQMVVYIADAISGARPGARYENFEEYVARLEKLEEISTQYDIVREAYAIQAGREVRVLLDPEKSKDNDVQVLALKIKDQIQEEMTYPGTVTVNVIREKRGKQIAK